LTSYLINAREADLTGGTEQPDHQLEKSLRNGENEGLKNEGSPNHWTRC